MLMNVTMLAGSLGSTLLTGVTTSPMSGTALGLGLGVLVASAALASSVWRARTGGSTDPGARRAVRARGPIPVLAAHPCRSSSCG